MFYNYRIIWVIIILFFVACQKNPEKIIEKKFHIPEDIDLGNEPLDSLKNLLQWAKKQNGYPADTLKVRLMLEIGWEILYNDPEKSMKYAVEAENIINRLKKIFPDDTNLSRLEINLFSILAANYYIRSDYLKALDNYFVALKIAKKLKNDYAVARITANIGIVYQDMEQFQKAIEYYQQALALARKLNNQLGVSIILGNLGSTYYRMKDYDRSLDYYIDALKIRKELNNPQLIAGTLNNIGLVYLDISKTLQNNETQKERNRFLKLAEDYFKQSLIIADSLKDFNQLALVKENLGQLYLEKGEYTKAKKMLEGALAIDTTYDFKEYARQTIESMSTLYDSISKLHLKNDCQLAYALKDKAMKYLMQTFRMKEELLKENNQNDLIKKELKFQYELEKAKQQAEYEKNMAVKKEENKKQKQALILLGCFLLISLGFLVFINRQKNIILKQKQLVEEQKQVIEIKNKDIRESLQYARKIHRSKMPSIDGLKNFFNDVFLLYRPKFEVGGDFYYFKQYDEWLYLAVGDCTGHGVPGALLSMISVEMIDGLAKKKMLPNEILKEMNNQFHENTNQNSDRFTSDGLVLGLLAVNLTNQEIMFSGANRPLWIWRNDNKMLETVKPDIWDIGGFAPKDTTYSLHKLNAGKGDIFYLFSDGYPDQIGGEKLKKFSLKRFQQLVNEISELPFAKQEEILISAFEEWQGNNEQTDDVIVMGVRL